MNRLHAEEVLGEGQTPRRVAAAVHGVEMPFRAQLPRQESERRRRDGDSVHGCAKKNAYRRDAAAPPLELTYPFAAHTTSAADAGQHGA